MDESGTTTALALAAAVAELEASGAQRFDPVRFCYIKAMTMRSQKQGEAVAAVVTRKAAAALREYRSRFTRERTAAAALLKQIALHQPATLDHARSLYDSYNFRALQRLAGHRRRPPAEQTLTSLLHQLDKTEMPASNSCNPGSVSELLRKQESEAIQTLADAVSGPPLPAPGAGELKAVRYFRASMQQQRADKLACREVLDAPADSGPLNPQKLAIRSLAAMRDLSPAYLGCFVSYVDTLFWLETAGQKSKS